MVFRFENTEYELKFSVENGDERSIKTSNYKRKLAKVT